MHDLRGLLIQLKWIFIATVSRIMSSLPKMPSPPPSVWFWGATQLQLLFAGLESQAQTRTNFAPFQRTLRRSRWTMTRRMLSENCPASLVPSSARHSYYRMDNVTPFTFSGTRRRAGLIGGVYEWSGPLGETTRFHYGSFRPVSY